MFRVVVDSVPAGGGGETSGDQVTDPQQGTEHNEETFKADSDTRTITEIKNVTNNEGDFDDVFDSAPAWMDVPEEYLDIRYSKCALEIFHVYLIFIYEASIRNLQ